ncbi:aldehyde dehydrogenase A [Escherichia coli]|nr:aldehyde dehydrogenase A [Escherichia coli]
MSVPVQHPMYIDGQFVTWRGDVRCTDNSGHYHLFFF